MSSKEIENFNEETSKEEEIESAELLEDLDLPEEAKKVVQFGMQMQRFSGQLPNPIHEKITAEHINQILELSKSEDEHQFQYAKSGRLMNFIVILVVAGLFIFLVVYLSKDNPDLLEDIIKVAVGLIGGFGAGYGYKSARS